MDQSLEEQLRTTLNTVPAYSWYSAPSGALTFVNNRYADYLGLAKDHPLRFGAQTGVAWDTHLQLVHPDDHEPSRRVGETILRTGSASEATFRVRDANGVYRWFLSRVEPLSASDGTVLFFIGITLDIEDRKRAEHELREALLRNEHYLEEAQRLSHTGSFGWTPDDGAIVWSDETYRIFEYDTALEPTLDSVVRRVHPDDRALVQEVLDRASRTGTDFEHEYRLLLADGRVKHVHAIAHAVQNASGHREFIGAVTDITERKTAEEQIRGQEAERLQMLDFTPLCIGVVGSDWSPLYANRASLDYLGMSLDEWRQKGQIGDEAHPDDRERLIAEGTRAASTGSAFELEVRVRKGDGSFRWFLSRFNPLHDDKGQVKRWFIASADIEDRKRSEERLQQQNVALREEIDKTSMFEEIVGASPRLAAVLSRVSRVAATDSTVLITGETGTGKELIARAVHRRSGRSSEPFVAVNCAAIPRELIASELFGHEKGAFTGAIQRRLGRFELADRGTVFLDEVGELSPEVQVALLRVLQEREIERVGGSQPIRVDVRVIAATHRDLTSDIERARFRQDLLYRLNVFPLDVPPLRERREDIPLLVKYFIDRYARKAGKSIRRVNKRALDHLQSYPWPGNVRELQNVIERSAILCDSDEFTIDESWLSTAPAVDGRAKLSNSLVAQEKAIVEEALRAANGRVFGPSGAAERLGIPRSTLESRIRSLKIDKGRFRRPAETA